MSSLHPLDMSRFSLPNIYQIADLPIEKMDDVEYLDILYSDINTMYATLPDEEEKIELIVETQSRILKRLNDLERKKSTIEH